MKRAYEYSLDEWEVLLDLHPIVFFDEDEEVEVDGYRETNKRITISKDMNAESGKRYKYRVDYHNEYGECWGEDSAETFVELLLRRVFQWRYIEYSDPVSFRFL